MHKAGKLAILAMKIKKSLFIAYLLAQISAQNLKHRIPIALLRVAVGFVFTMVFSAVFLALWALINATGISIILSFILLLAAWALKLLWWVIKIIIIIVYAAWSILKWIWGLIF
jgi:hypothetical protein